MRAEKRAERGRKVGLKKREDGPFRAHQFSKKIETQRQSPALPKFHKIQKNTKNIAKIVKKTQKK